MFVKSKAGFILNKPPSYFLPWSVSGGGGRIAGKALRMEQDNVRKLIANKIGLTLFPLTQNRHRHLGWVDCGEQEVIAMTWWYYMTDEGPVARIDSQEPVSGSTLRNARRYVL